MSISWTTPSVTSPDGDPPTDERSRVTVLYAVISAVPSGVR